MLHVKAFSHNYNKKLTRLQRVLYETQTMCKYNRRSRSFVIYLKYIQKVFSAALPTTVLVHVTG